MHFRFAIIIFVLLLKVKESKHFYLTPETQSGDLRVCMGSECDGMIYRYNYCITIIFKKIDWNQVMAV